MWTISHVGWVRLLGQCCSKEDGDGCGLHSLPIIQCLTSQQQGLKVKQHHAAAHSPGMAFRGCTSLLKKPSTHRDGRKRCGLFLPPGQKGVDQNLRPRRTVCTFTAHVKYIPSPIISSKHYTTWIPNIREWWRKTANARVQCLFTPLQFRAIYIYMSFTDLIYLNTSKSQHT